jgi:hypothetical protein
MNSIDSLFEYKDVEYKVYTEVISCDNKKLCVNQYIGGTYEDDYSTQDTIISEKEFIDLYKLDGAEAVLHSLNEKEFIRLSKYIAQQKKTVKIYQEKGKSIQADSILNSLDVPYTWIQNLTNWFVNHGFDIPVYEVKKLPKYEEYRIEFNNFYNDKNADPKKVKLVLNDKSRWINPSKYLKDARKSVGIGTVDELKKHPGFGWINPNSNAHD